MEQVKPNNLGALNLQSGKGKDKNNPSAGADALVTNMSWNPSLKKCWEASGFTVLNDMLKNKPENTELPKFSNDIACLSWLIKGKCHSTCICANCHKQAGAAVIKNMHKLMDTCRVPTSN